jgi:steroid 5-alpha reductase family enzyme
MASTFISIASICIFFVASLPLRLYLSSLETNIVLCLAFSTYAFIKSNVTGNHSQVDELWNLLPIFFSFHFNKWTYRGNLMFSIVFIWGVRLAYNFWRKGGYRGVEDHRWPELRKIITNPILWQIFNFFFISYYQNFLLLSITLPVYYETGSDLGLLDYVIWSISIGLIIIETTADQQQWDFQSEKLRKRKLGQEIKLGFITTGLFKYSRHPNVCAEIFIWWSLYFFTYSFNFSIIGTVLLNILIYSSTKFTEKISSSKYVEYKNYQKTTSMIIPWFPDSSKNI